MEHSLTSLIEIKRCARNLQIKPRAKGRNIFGCYMLRMFAHPVACCVVLLGAVAQSLKLVKRLAQQGWACCVRFHVALVKNLIACR